MLLGGEQILAQVFVLLGGLGGGGGGLLCLLTALLCLLLGIHLRHRAFGHLLERVVVLLLGLAEGLAQGLQGGVVGLLGVLAVLFDAQLLLRHHILQEHGFLLGQYHV